jgi:hypothetical protein
MAGPTWPVLQSTRTKTSCSENSMDVVFESRSLDFTRGVEWPPSLGSERNGPSPAPQMSGRDFGPNRAIFHGGMSIAFRLPPSLFSAQPKQQRCTRRSQRKGRSANDAVLPGKRGPRSLVTPRLYVKILSYLGTRLP